MKPPTGQDPRRWWTLLVFAMILAIILILPRNRPLILQATLVACTCFVFFLSGYLYGHRLRELGRRPRFPLFLLREPTEKQFDDSGP